MQPKKWEDTFVGKLQCEEGPPPHETVPDFEQPSSLERSPSHLAKNCLPLNFVFWSQLPFETIWKKFSSLHTEVLAMFKDDTGVYVALSSPVWMSSLLSDAKGEHSHLLQELSSSNIDPAHRSCTEIGHLLCLWHCTSINLSILRSHLVFW